MDELELSPIESLEVEQEIPLPNEVELNEPEPNDYVESLVEEPQEIPLTRDEVANALKQLLQNAENEDRALRDRYLNIWQRLDFYWNNILDIFQDPTTGIWRTPNWTELEGELPPRLINIYRPHGEAIVAALSIEVPAVYFHPDDADNPDDIEAAKAYRSIVELLQLHNDAPMQIIKSIVTLFNYGTIFGYNYRHADPKFGTIKSPKIQLTDITTFQSLCPQCGTTFDVSEGQPDIAYSCVECGYQGPPEVIPILEQIPQIVGFDESPKGTVCQEIYSGLNVKVPAYVRKQEDCGYLLLRFLQGTAMLRSVFQEEGIEDGQSLDWESYAKIPISYLWEMPENAANVSCLWVRSWQFFQLPDKLLVARLVKTFPDGCYAIFVNDNFMVAYPENMDDHWTISANPMGDNLYARPLGENLSTIQDIRAQLVEIEIQTAEFGIPETFADPRVLDFTKYGQGQSKPGMITQVKAQPGKSIADGFHTNKPAVLSPEIAPLKSQMDQDAQFVTGSFASVYGGVMQGGSKTASEYAQSRAAALQRLGTIWRIVKSFWCKFQSRSAVEYANVLKELGEDERFTKRDGENFVNNWIRVSSLRGKVGRVEPESSEQLPVSWAAKKDELKMLLATNNDMILSWLAAPENIGFVKDTLGIPELHIPGENARVRQLTEFQMTAQGIDVPINPEIDNHAVHIQVLKSLLESPIRDGLTEQGFQATMAHLSYHLEYEAMMMQQQMDQQLAAQQGSAPESGPQQGEK